jgi:hypothetical protein
MYSKGAFNEQEAHRDHTLYGRSANLGLHKCKLPTQFCRRNFQYFDRRLRKLTHYEPRSSNTH